MPDEPGRYALIDAKREKAKLVDGMLTMSRAIEVLMDDRVRHLTALRQVAELTLSGQTVLNADVAKIVREALEPVRD